MTMDQTQNGPPNTVGIGGDKDNPLNSGNVRQGPELPNLSHILEGMINIRDVQNKMLELSGDLKASLDEIPKSLKDTVEQLKRIHTSVKDTVSEVEDTVDAYAKLKKRAEEFNRTLNDSTRSEHQKKLDFQDMIDSFEKLVKFGRLNTTQLQEAGDHIERLKKGYQDVLEKVMDLTNPLHVRQYQVSWENALRTIKAFGVEYKSINSTGLRARQDNMRAAFSQAGFYMKPGYRDRAVRMGQLAANFKENTKHHIAEIREAFDEKRTAGGFGGNIVRKRNGRIDWKAYSKPGDALDRESWGDKGLQSEFEKLGGNSKSLKGAYRALAESKAGGPSLSLMNRMRLGIAERGGAVSGLANWGMGLVEKGIGMGAGVMATPGVGESLALLSLVRAGFDKQIEINQGIEKNLGTAGVFAPGQGSVFQNMRNVETNLMPSFGGGFYNTLGITYKKNMEVAQAMASSGVGLSELQQDNSVFKNSRWGPGSYGAIQHTAYTTARLAGFDTAAGTAQAVKLIQAYGQSLQSTHEFFITLTKDAQAAGMTTVKYVSIIDDVTSGLDNMNKSFETAVSVVRMLGASGGSTAEDIKEMVSAISGNGEKRPLRTDAFLYSQMAKSGRASQSASSEQERVRVRSGELAKSIEQAGVTGNGFEGLYASNGGADKIAGMGTGVMNLQSLLATAGGEPNAQRTGLVKQIQAVFQASAQVNKYSQLQQGGNGLLAASQSQFIKPDLLSQILEENNAVMSNLDLQHKSMGDLRRMVAAQGGTQESLLTGGLAEKFGGAKPQQLVDILQAHTLAAGSVIKEIQSYTSPEDALKFIGSIGGRGFRGKAAQDVLDLATSKNADKLTELSNRLVDSGLMVGELGRSGVTPDGTEVDKLEDIRAATVNIATTSTADMFANSFEHLFMLIVKPVNDILDVLPGHSPAAAGSIERMRYDVADRHREKAIKNIVDYQKRLSPNDPQQPGLRDLLSELNYDRPGLDATPATLDRVTAKINSGLSIGSDYQSSEKLNDTFKYNWGDAILGRRGILGGPTPIQGKTAADNDRIYSGQVDAYLNRITGIDPKTGQRYINSETGKPYTDAEAAGLVMRSLVNMEKTPGDIQIKDNQLVIPSSELTDPGGGESPMAKFLDRVARLPGGGFFSNADKPDNRAGWEGGKTTGYSTVNMTIYNNTNGQLFQGIIGGQQTARTSSQNVTAVVPKVRWNDHQLHRIIPHWDHQ